MDNKPNDEFSYLVNDDGEELLLPADHDERVRDLCAKLMTPNNSASEAILATRYDGELTQEYGTLVAMSALEMLCTWMVNEADFLRAVQLCNEIPNMMMAARIDRSSSISDGASPAVT